MTWWRRLFGFDAAAEFMPRWKAFLTAPAAQGEPTIAPAKVPAVKTLVGKKRGRVVSWYRRVS